MKSWMNVKKASSIHGHPREDKLRKLGFNQIHLVWPVPKAGLCQTNTKPPTLFPQHILNISIFMEVYNLNTGVPMRQTVHLHMQTHWLSLGMQSHGSVCSLSVPRLLTNRGGMAFSFFKSQQLTVRQCHSFLWIRQYGKDDRIINKSIVYCLFMCKHE